MPSSCASVAPALWKTRPSPSSRMPGRPSAKKCASDCGIDACSASIDMRSRPVPAKIAAGSMPKERLSLAGSARRLPSSATSQSTLARLAGCTSIRRWMRLSGMLCSAIASASGVAGQPVAEGVRRALEDQRQAGRALRRCPRAPAGWRGSGRDRRCAASTIHGDSGSARAARGAASAARGRQRLDADAVVGARHQRILERAAGRAPFRQARASARARARETRTS